MTDKELHRLSRRDILQLMLAQGKETEELRQVKAELEQQLEELTQNYERLKKRLDYKDEQIHQLQDTLQKERTNRRIELEEAGSIAEASLRLNGLFETAQKAADQYLYNIRRLYLKSLKESSNTKEERQDSDSKEMTEEYREEEAATVIKAQSEALEAVDRWEGQDGGVEFTAEGQDRVPEAIGEDEEDKAPEAFVEVEEHSTEQDAAMQERPDEVWEDLAEEEKQDEASEAVKEEKQHELSRVVSEDKKQDEASEAVAEDEKQDGEPEPVSGEEMTGKRKFSIFRRKKKERDRTEAEE